MKERGRECRRILTNLVIINGVNLHLQFHIGQIDFPQGIDVHITREIDVEPAKPAHLGFMLLHGIAYLVRFPPIQNTPEMENGNGNESTSRNMKKVSLEEDLFLPVFGHQTRTQYIHHGQIFTNHINRIQSIIFTIYNRIT